MIAKLQIETSWKDRSVLKHAFYTPPFKVADITEDFSPGVLQLTLMNVSPGILDGDDYRLEINVGENSSLRLHTQSYQRLFTMQSSAFQLMNVHLEKNSSFFFLPHPTVPHKESNFKAENNIFLSAGCELLWGEILTCGRKGCGEVFSFTQYHSLTKIYFNGKLVVKENLLLRPATAQLQMFGQWEGYTHQASLIYWNEKIVMQSLMTSLHDLLKAMPGLCLGISLLPINGLLIRVLGNSAEKIFDLFKEIVDFIYQQKLGAETKVENDKAVVHAC
ncbi:MAG: urease accessory protein UreD [Bacteroidota bacterium]